MNKLILIILLMSSSAMAAEYKLNLSHTRIDQNLFSTISFPMDAIKASGSICSDYNLCFELSLARSTETANRLYVEGKQYSTTIDHLFSGAILYRFNINDKWTAYAGVGKTDYKSTWKVNGKPPIGWGNGSDSDWSYHAYADYKYTKHLSMRFEYIDYYRKDKEGYGREETRGYSFGFAYLF